MTFADIERVIGTKLPASKRYAAWWSNNETNNVMTKEWLAAGYRSEQVDVEGQSLVFRKADIADRPRDSSKSEAATESGIDGEELHHTRHPAYGCLKGMVRIAPGTDLTAPSAPEWAENAEDAAYAPLSNGR